MIHIKYMKFFIFYQGMTNMTNILTYIESSLTDLTICGVS